MSWKVFYIILLHTLCLDIAIFKCRATGLRGIYYAFVVSPLAFMGSGIVDGQYLRIHKTQRFFKVGQNLR